MKSFIFLICLLAVCIPSFYRLNRAINSKVFETIPYYTSGEPLPTQEPVNIVDNYTLPRSFGFYRGSIPMCDIETITFSTSSPDSFDECWSANITGTDEVKGYLVGYDIIIVGEQLYANKNCTHMFAAHNSYGDPLWSSLHAINGLELLNTSLVNNMSMMFAFTELTSLSGIENWDVSNVKTFAGMFQGHNNAGDIKITYLDVSRWDMSSAENLSHIFYGCGALEYIPIENWNVSNVITFSHMFADCYNLKTLDISNWETSSVESFDGFLNDCHSLTEIDVSNLRTGTCRQFSQMFEYCYNLERIIGISAWDVSNASHYAFSEMFNGCHVLEELDLSSWNTAPDNTACMFKDCFCLRELDLSGFDMSNTLYTNDMFTNCNSLLKIIYNNENS